MSTFRRLATVSSLVLAAVAASACDAELIGAAAVVGDDRFTVAALQSQVEQVQSLEGFDISAVGGASVLQRELLSRHIQHQLFLRLAGQEDIDVSQADVDNAIDEYKAQVPDGDLGPVLAQNAYTDEAFRAGIFDRLVAEDFTTEHNGDQQALIAALNEVGDQAGVEVNPRYGSWGDDISVAEASGSISKALDAAVSASP